jgi:ribonucleoside-diphosphate reductase alpha chain
VTTIAAVSQQIWDMKYRFKAADGGAIDKTIEDTWRRVAEAVAATEAEPALWAGRYYEALEDFKFLPAGRILAGAGTGRNVTLFNCFVMGTIPDDMGGIFDQLREAALTMQQGGGIGYDFSTLRPKGAPVRGVGADASGPLSFMDVWDAMCRTIMSAGSRRGAMMATMRCDHPDIEAFVDAKRDPARLRMFNLSVLVTDPFMQAVEQDQPWELKFDGTVFRTVGARALWDRIMRATYEYAEPGVIFIDRINRRNNLHYCETIAATNPCLTADAWIMTADGPRQIAELVGRPFAAIAEGRSWPCDGRGFFSSGVKPVVTLLTREGHRLRLTADHRVRKVTRRTRFSCETEWVAAGSLLAGDAVLLHDHRKAPDWGAGEPGREAAEGYLLGLLLGDGVIKSDKTVLSVWPGRLAANGGDERPGIRGVMEATLAATDFLPHRADFRGWVEVPGRGEHRLAMGALKRLAEDHGMRPRHKAITPAIERRSAAFCRGFLRGLFDADGSVQGNQAKGVSVRLAQSDLDTLRAAQRMLLRLGVASTIYAERRAAGTKRLPDGKAGHKDYAIRAQHELVVGGENLRRFADEIGFADSEKAARLKALLGGYRRALNRESFCATVASIVPAGEAEVFDATIPGLNAFDANGFWAHNCGEQPLPPYGACLLGSVNLAALVEHPFEPGARLDLDRLKALVPVAVRMMDAVIDASRFPLGRQKEEAQAKRRIGLGITGLADALIMCGARYGSAESVTLAGQWAATIEREAYLASAALAAEKGPFPLFDAERYLAGETVRGLDDDVKAAIGAHGIRNALLTSIAPTGTISLLADNVSSGIEPVFSFTSMRTVLMPDGSRRHEEVTDHAYRLFRRLRGDEATLPESFVDAQILAPEDHLVMQAAVQRHVDSSISKTINVPIDMPFEAFKDVYRRAYALGCKGCTTYRPNEVTGAVLAVPEAAIPEPAVALRPAEEAGAVYYMTQPLSRPEVLPGRTYKLKWPESDHAIYITINDIVQDGRRRPFEVFINSKNMDHYAWTVGLTRMISAVFRRGGDVSFVVEELKAVFDPRGGAWMNRRYVPSLLAAIGDVIEQHLIEIGFLPPREETVPAARAAVAVGEGSLARCPRCHAASLMHQEGCALCTNCGYSKCG